MQWGGTILECKIKEGYQYPRCSREKLKAFVSVSDRKVLHRHDLTAVCLRSAWHGTL